MGTTIRSVRIPNHFAGPFESEQEFNEYLLWLSWSGGFRSEEAYHDTLMRAKRIEKLSHRIGFTHGDLKPPKHEAISIQWRADSSLSGSGELWPSNFSGRLWEGCNPNDEVVVASGVCDMSATLSTCSVDGRVKQEGKFPCAVG